MDNLAQFRVGTETIGSTVVEYFDLRGKISAPAAVAAPAPGPAAQATSQDPNAPAPATALLNSGYSIPLVGLGTWKAAPGEVRRAVDEALAAGYRHIDCASYYGNEHEVGEALKAAFAAGTVTRADLFICSKLWNSDHGKERVLPAARKSLSALGLTYLDAYLIHWPITGNVGPEVSPPLTETWAAMEGLVDAGLVCSIGVSNFSAVKLGRLLSTARIPPAICQVECHPYLRQAALRAFCASVGIHVTAYSPLGSPDSAALLRRSSEAPKLLDDPVVAAIAARRGVSPAQVCLRWGVQQGLSVLPKSVTPARIKANLDLFGSFKLEPLDMAQLGCLPQRRMVDGRFFLSARGPYRTLRELWDEDEGLEAA